MHAELKDLLYAAEDHYLSQQELQSVSQNIAGLSKRLETYELVRNHEIEIFQPVADQLSKAFPQEEEPILERSLKYWMLVLRYCSMAMLMNSVNFLDRQLLEWLTDIVQAHANQAIEQKVYSSLEAQLKQVLSAEQLQCLQPFLERAQATLLQTKALV